MPQKKGILLSEQMIETCGDPGCVACRVRIVTTIMLQLESAAPNPDNVTNARAGVYDLILCAAILAQEKERIGLAEFMEAAKSGFDAGEDFRRMVARVEADESTKH